MKSITSDILVSPPDCLVLTCDRISSSGELFAADFRDEYALYSEILLSYLGFHSIYRVVTVHHTFELVNGFYVAKHRVLDNKDPLWSLKLSLRPINN